MNFEILTMHEKLILIRSMIERGGLLVNSMSRFDDEIRITYDELAANFTPDKNRIAIQI